MLSTRRRFFEATRSPATAALRVPALFPAIVITDSTPPSQPGTPVGTAASTSQINWTWTASTDSGGSGLAGYRVYVDGAATPTTTVTTNAYSSTGHTASTSHTLRVEAFDNAGNSISSGTGSQTTQAASGGTFTPFYAGKFTAGNIGALCNTEYSGFNSTDNNARVVYSNDITGPFGETRVGKVLCLQPTPQNTTADGPWAFYGGAINGGTFSTANGADLWVRAYLYFPTSWCCGSGNANSDWFGSTKFFRLIWDGAYRQTLLMADYAHNACSLPSQTPYLDVLNSEVSSQNVTLTKQILARDTWYAIQLHWKFNDSGAGIGEVWLNSTRLGRSTTQTNRPVGSQYDTCNAMNVPGDYFNGSPYQTTAFYVANIIATQQAPNTLDSFGNPYISPSLDARSL